MTADLTRERYRRLAGRPPFPQASGQGLPAIVGRVATADSLIGVGKYLTVNPVEVFGAETEGVAGTLSAWPTQMKVLLLGPAAAHRGDHLVCYYVGNRWVAGRGTGPAPVDPPPGAWLRPIQLKIGMCAASVFVPTYMGYPTNVNVLVVQGTTTLYNGPPVRKDWGTTGIWAGIYTGVRVDPVTANVPVEATVTAPGFKTVTYSHTPVWNEAGYPGASLELVPEDGYVCGQEPCCPASDQPGFPFLRSKFLDTVTTLFFNDTKGVFTLEYGLCTAASTPSNQVYGYRGCAQRTAKFGYAAVSELKWPYYTPQKIANISCPIYVEAYCTGVPQSGPYAGQPLWSVEGYCVHGKTYRDDPATASCNGVGPATYPSAGVCPIDSPANCPGMVRILQGYYFVSESCPPGFTATGVFGGPMNGYADIYNQFYDTFNTTGVLFQ